MIGLKKHRTILPRRFKDTALVALALLCSFSSQQACAQSSEQALWNNIDLIHPDVKVLSKESNKKRKTKFVKGQGEVLLPIGGALLVGSAVLLLSKKEVAECPETQASPDVLTIRCGEINSTNFLANDYGEDILIESIDLSNLPNNLDAQVGEGVITLTGFSESSFQIPYSIRDECGNMSSSFIEVNYEGAPNIEAVPDLADAQTLEATTFFVTENDLGLNLLLQSANAESGSSVSINNNSIVYTPITQNLTSDILNYTIVDDCGQTASSTVTVSFPITQEIVAQDDFLTINCNSSSVINVLDNDMGDNLSIESVSGAPAGIDLSFDDSGFVSISGFETEAFSFTYTVVDNLGGSDNGLVTINVFANSIEAITDVYTTDGNEALLFNPIGNDLGTDLTIASFDQPFEGGQVSFTATENELRFDPSLDFTGTINFNYTITDNCNQTSSATVEINVVEVVANEDFFTVGCNQPLTMNVMANDEGEFISVVSINNTSPVELVINADNTISAANVGGQSFSFHYALANEDNWTDIGLVNVEVLVSDLQTVNDTIYTTGIHPIVLNPILNDIGEGLQLLSISEPTNGGQVSVDGNDFTYTPTIGFVGESNFAYSVQDLCGNTTDGIIVIIVEVDTNNCSTLFAVDDNATTLEETALVIDHLTNDTFTSGLVSYVLAPNMAGDILINDDNTITFTPNTGFVGTTIIEYTLMNECDQTASAQITITVDAVVSMVVNAPTLRVSRFFELPNQRRVEQGLLLSPILDGLPAPVEHPLVSAEAFAEGKWFFQEQLHFDINLSQSISENASVNFGFSNTNFLATRLVNNQHFLPRQISINSLSGSYKRYLDKRNIFYAEAGVQVHRLEVKNLESKISEAAQSLVQPYVRLGVQWQLHPTFGLESNVTWEKELANSSKSLASFQVGVFKNLW